MDTHEVKSEESFALEDVWNGNAADIDEVRKDNNSCIEPSYCHSDRAKEGGSAQCCFAEASHILGENVGNVVQIHHNGTAEGHVH